jgi:hypothetical protein
LQILELTPKRVYNLVVYLRARSRSLPVHLDTVLQTPFLPAKKLNSATNTLAYYREVINYSQQSFYSIGPRLQRSRKSRSCLNSIKKFTRVTLDFTGTKIEVCQWLQLRGVHGRALHAQPYVHDGDYCTTLPLTLVKFFVRSAQLSLILLQLKTATLLFGRQGRDKVRSWADLIKLFGPFCLIHQPGLFVSFHSQHFNLFIFLQMGSIS